MIETRWSITFTPIFHAGHTGKINIIKSLPHYNCEQPAGKTAYGKSLLNAGIRQSQNYTGL